MSGNQREPIPVAWIRFEPKTFLKLPGKQIGNEIRSRAHDPNFAHEIQYLPWLHSFRVTHYPFKGEPETVMVMSCHVASWKDLEKKPSKPPGK